MIAVAERQRVLPAAPVLDGIKQMAPAAIGVVPFATMIGVAIGESPMLDVVGFVGGFLTAGGSAHLAATGSITVGAGFIATVVTALMINARGLVYSAALAPSLRHQPRWFRWVAAYGLVDQMFILVSGVLDRGDRYVRSFYLSAMALLWSAYMGGVALGIVVGPVVPASIPLGLAIPVMFLAMLVPGVKGRSTSISVIVAMVVAFVGADFPSGAGLIAGIVAGTVVGAISEGNHDA